MQNSNAGEVVEHLFRQEAGKLAASLTRTFGLSRLETVEDIVQDALLAALTDWSFRGIPENPTAWLHRVAKNKAVDRIRKRQLEEETASELLPGMREASTVLQMERNFLDWEIDDSQLRMMFACCYPGLPVEAQIALILKTLCGFSVREIASAFLTQETTIEKRLGRARKYFREHHVELEVPSAKDAHDRLPTVLHSLYLLFNEGYKRTDSDGLVQSDLCLEALRLALLVAYHPRASSPESLALVSLMSLLSARFDARTDAEGNMILLSEQDRTKWNHTLIEQGLNFIARSEPDRYLSKYHIEAAIQSVYVTSRSFEETDWAAILGLYKRLYALEQNPIVALHMSVSIGFVHGAQAAIEWLHQHAQPDYYLYHALMADAERNANLKEDAANSYQRAIELTVNPRERDLLQQKLKRLLSSN